MAPASVAHAVELLAEHQDSAKVLAGGQSLMPMLNMRLAYPSVLVDINRLRELAFVREEGGHLRIGALARQAVVEDSPTAIAVAPLLKKALAWVGHRAIRNRGTVCGSLAHADPASELPAVATVLEGEVTAVSSRGRREIPVADLFSRPLVSTLEPDELLLELRLPKCPSKEGSAVVEVARRRGDFALAGVAATVLLGKAEAVESVRLVSFATGPRPLRLRDVEGVLTGRELTPATLDLAAHRAFETVQPSDDVHATGDYRRSVTAELVRRAVLQAAADARARVGAVS